MRSKIFTLFFAFLLTGFSASAVMLKGVTATTVSFYNFSGGSYSLAGHYLTIGSASYPVDDMGHVHRSSLVVPAGGTIVLQGLTIPSTGSIGLWSGSTLTAIYMVDYVQYGAAGQPYEAIANTAGRWVTGQFVSVAPPFQKSTNNYNDVGGSFWAASSTGLSYVQNNVDVKVFANFTGDVMIDLSALTDLESVQIEIVNISGQVLMQAPAGNQNKFSLDARNLATGIYMASVYVKGQRVSTTRFFKG